LSARYATVARGANALQYGASTLGGAIDFITPTAHNSPAGEFFFNNGGDGGQTLVRATLSRIFENGSDALVTVEGKQGEGFREHNEQERFGLYANAGMELSNSVSTRFYATHIDNQQELAGSLNRAQIEEDPDQANPSAVPGNFQVDVVTSRVANKTVWTLGAGRSLEAGVSYERQELFHPIVFTPFFSLLIDTDHEDIGTVVNYRQRSGDHDFLFGFTYGEGSVKGEHYENLGGGSGGQRGELMEYVNNKADSLELYAVDRWRLDDRWTLVLAAQSVSASRDAKTTVAGASGAISNPKDDYSSFNPRIGTIYAAGEDVSLFANISKLYEPPTNFELADEASGSGATLDAMHGAVVEFGSRGSHSLNQSSRWYWDVAVYYAEIQDEILSVDDPAAPGTSLSANVDQTIHAGVEALLSLELALDEASTDSITPLLSITLNEFSFDNDAVYGDNRLPAAPEHAVRGEVLYRRANGFYMGPTFDMIGDRYADFMNTYKVDSYILFGLRAGWSGEKWRAFIDIQNIGDKEYIASHGVRDSAAIDADILNPGAPLSAYLGLQMQL
jgi:iron complex outermembrane receptor protein